MTSPSLRPAQGIKVGLKTVYLYDADWVPVVSNAVTTCTDQAVIATTQAGIATTQAEISTTQAVISTTQAGIATSAANSLLNDAGYIAVSADLAGSNTIGTCATNIAAIQAAPQAATDAEDARDLAQSYATAANVAKIEWQGSWSAGSYDESDAVEHNGSSWIATTTTTEEPSSSATDWDLLSLRGTDGTGTGDVSSSISSSTNNAVAVFDGVDGKTIKQGTAGTDYSAGTASLDTGILKSTTSTGALSIATAGTDYAKPDTKSSWTKQQSGTQYALTSTSNHIATDCDNGNNFSHTMTESTTLDNPSNIVAGTYYTWTITQHASSAKTLALGSYFKTADGAAFGGMPTTTSSISTLFAYAETTTTIVYNWVTKGAS